MEPLTGWEARHCKNTPTPVFYEHVWPQPEQTLMPNVKALEEARLICKGCPVRRECLLAAMEAERGQSEKQRVGVFAGMTPQQRHSLERRANYIPTSDDPDELCRLIPDRGDDWTDRHTKLARKVIGHLTAEYDADTRVPSASALATKMNVRRNDMRRVYDALLADGLLDLADKTLVRRAVKASTRSWLPPHLR